MYSIYFLILVSIFGSSIYCQSCFDSKTNCSISTICCVNLEIPKSIPRTGGLIRIFPNLTVDIDIENRTKDYSFRLESTISDFIEDAFVCNNISIHNSSWTCDIKKDADSKLYDKEFIENLYLIDNVNCCRIELILSNFSKIYVRDPGITYAPDYIFQDQIAYIDVQFTYCPNEYFTEYTDFTLEGSNLQNYLHKDPFIGFLCTFSVKVFDNRNSNFLSLITKINNRPLPNEIIIYIREKPSFDDSEWMTFQQLSLNLTIRGNNFDSLYQPHYELSPNVGYKNFRIAYTALCTPCQVKSNTLMQCNSPIILGEVFHEIYRLKMSSHGKRIAVSHNLRIKYGPTPVILSAWLSNETKKILEIKYNDISDNYPFPVIHVVHVKRDVYLHKIECIDVIKHSEDQMTCLLNEEINEKFRWWVEMTIGNYKLNRYCLAGCEPNLSDLSEANLLTYILIAVLIVLVSLSCLYICLKYRVKRQAASKHGRKLPEDTAYRVTSHPTSLLISLFNKKSSDKIGKSSIRLTRSKASHLIQKRLRRRAMGKNGIASGIDSIEET